MRRLGWLLLGLASAALHAGVGAAALLVGSERADSALLIDLMADVTDAPAPETQRAHAAPASSIPALPGPRSLDPTTASRAPSPAAPARRADTRDAVASPRPVASTLDASAGAVPTRPSDAIDGAGPRRPFDAEPGRPSAQPPAAAQIPVSEAVEVSAPPPTVDPEIVRPVP